MNIIRQLLHQPFFIRLLNWEYWSFNAVYGPIIPIWLLLCARARSLFFFSASNPTIYSGGFLMESKKDIYELIPDKYYPRTLYFPLPAEPVQVAAMVRSRGLTYPLIGKPDIGCKGQGVRKLKNESDLLRYCDESPLDFLVQEYIPYEKEAGIFYVRIPGEERGRITGIVSKEMLAVTGDGTATVRQLVMREKRFILQLKPLEDMHGAFLDTIPARNEKVELVPYGNHARGAKFLDDTHRVDPLLEAQIDAVSQQIPDFYYGRLDVRFNSWEELRQGKAFSIIELNGSGSEPTHIYDPSHSLFFAWKEIIRHWILLFRVSRRNHKNGIPYMSFREGRKMFRDNTRFEQLVKKIYV